MKLAPFRLPSSWIHVDERKPPNNSVVIVRSLQEVEARFEEGEFFEWETGDKLWDVELWKPLKQ